MTSPGALMLGTDLRALGIARSLGRRGIPVVALEFDRGVAMASRYLTRRLPCRDVRDEQARLERLLALPGAGYQGWTLFPSADDTAALVATHHAELSSSYLLTTPPWPVFEQAFDKRAVYAAAEGSGIRYPGTITVASVDDLPPGLGYPAVVKAAVRIRQTVFTEAKGWRADDPGELRDAWKRARRYAPPEEILVQRFVHGDGSSQFSYGALCVDGEVIASVTARRTRQYPRQFGRSSCLVETIRDDAVNKVAKAFLRAIAYSGLVEVEMKRDARTGELLLLDVNPRVWTWHSLACRAGADLPYLAWELAAGRPVDPVTARPGARWCRPVTDVPSALADVRDRRLSGRDWLRSVQPPIEVAPFASDDPMPGFAELPLLVARGAARLVRPVMTGGQLLRVRRIVRSFVRSPATTTDRLVERLVERRQPPPPRYETNATWEQDLHRLLGVPWPCGETETFAGAWSDVLGRFEQLGVPVGIGIYAGWNDGDAAFARAAWCAIRHLGARTVVETGVARGLVSAIALRALGDGKLYSLDLAPLTTTVDGTEIGMAVAPELRERWTCIAGSSRQRLPGLLQTIPAVDLFIHDSLHTDRNLRFELACVEPHLSERAVVLADDIDRNAVWADQLRRSPNSLVAGHDGDNGQFGISAGRTSRAAPEEPALRGLRGSLR